MAIIYFLLSLHPKLSIMATKDRYTTSAHCVYNMGFHIIFCPKYRRKVLVDGIDERLKVLLLEKATELGIQIEKMEVMPQ